MQLKVAAILATLPFSAFCEIVSQTNQPGNPDVKPQGGVTLPDGTFIPNTPKKVSVQQESNVEQKENRSIKDGASQSVYNDLKKIYERQKIVIKFIPSDDNNFYSDSINLLELYLKAYEEGNMESARIFFNRFDEKINDTLKNKPVIAYKYNELIKKFLETEVTFGIYKNSDDFYLAIGDGAFKTVATLSVNNIMSIIQAYEKSMKWSVQCFDEKMEVTKPLGSFGGVSIEFDSKAEGGFVRYIFHIKGQMDSDRLLSEQTVWMTGLNFSCLINRMRNAPEMYEKHKKAQSNAEKLK